MKFNYITVDQAAARRGVSRTAIYDAIQSNRLPHVRLLGKIALLPADVDDCTFAPRNGLRKDHRLGPRKKIPESAETP